MKKIYYKKQDGSTGQVSPYIININSDKIPESIFGLSRIREFSESYPYKSGSLFMKDDVLYRAIDSHLGSFGTGSWCTKTSLYSEILKMAESDYINKTITMTERMWDAIESSPYAMAEFLRDYTGYTLDVIEDYDEPDISPDNYIVGERLVLAGVIQVEGRLIGLTGTVAGGILTITVSSKSDVDPGDDTHEFDGGVVNGVLGIIISNVSGSGVLGPIIGSVSSAGVLSIFGSSGGGGGSGGGGEVVGDVLKITGSVGTDGILSVTGAVQAGVLSVTGSSSPGGGGDSDVPSGSGSAIGVYGDILRLEGGTKIEGTVVNNTLNITV